jgi:hypothetical protein
MAIDMKFLPKDNLKMSTLASPLGHIEGSLNLTESIEDDKRDEHTPHSPKLNSIFLQREIVDIHRAVSREGNLDIEMNPSRVDDLNLQEPPMICAFTPKSVVPKAAKWKEIEKKPMQKSQYVSPITLWKNLNQRNWRKIKCGVDNYVSIKPVRYPEEIDA